MRAFFIAFALTLAALVSAKAEDVTLYFEPSTKAAVAARVPESDPMLLKASPVADAALARQGWHQVPLTGTFTGYVPRKAVHKDLTVEPGTPIHAKPAADSPVLLTAPVGTNFVKDAPKKFAEVEFSGTLTVYFLKKAAPKVVAPPPPPPPPPPAPVAKAPQQPKLGSGAIYSRADAREAFELPRYFIGRLELKTSTLTFIQGPTPYLLRDAQGLPIGWIDFNDATLTRPIETYFGNQVVIYGTAHPTDASPGVLIRAKTLQINDQ